MGDRRQPDKGGRTGDGKAAQGRSATDGGREERLSAALRANLRRRKQQQQARQAGAGDAGPSDDDSSGGG